MKPFCFILMPFGTKTDQNGKTVEFDVIYEKIIKPAVEEAELTPIRADEEIIGGIIYKPMFERLMLCDYAIADLTTANANVLYELGIRHGIRPHSTILIFSEGMRLPFDVAPLRAIPYKIDDNGYPFEIETAKKRVIKRLNECRNPIDDSPLYQLISNIPRIDISRLKTDTFRDSVEYSKYFKAKLKEARQKDYHAVFDIEKELGNIKDVDPGIVIDLFLSYRAVEKWEEMVKLFEKMHPLLKQSVLVQEQLGFAYNRLGNHYKAEAILKELIEKFGPSSETNGILGRVYKDLWKKNMELGKKFEAHAYLRKSIECYLQGFEADWRDAYPGINAVTLMEMLNPIDTRQSELIPVVKYAVKRRLTAKNVDYWDYATLLELSIITKNKETAFNALEDVLIHIREKWEPKTTANNIRLIINARNDRGGKTDWIEDIEQTLIKVSEKG